jgi:hypothetical protein
MEESSGLPSPSSPNPPIAAAISELLGHHVAARQRRNAATLGSPEYRAASEDVARIEVEIARIGRSADPPLV